MDETKKIQLSTLDIMHGVMRLYNYRDTAGVIFFRSGGAIKVPSFYDYFQEEWMDYKKAQASENKEDFKKYLRENNGGIITNGFININLMDVVAMIKENGEGALLKFLNFAEDEED